MNYLGRVRRVGLIVAGVGSGFLGLVVAWTLVQPGIIGTVGTGALLAIFGLLALPAVVYWSWCADTKAAARQAARARTLAESAAPKILSYSVQPLQRVSPILAAAPDPSGKLAQGHGAGPAREPVFHTHTHQLRAEPHRAEPHRADTRRRVGPISAASPRRPNAAG